YEIQNLLGNGATGQVFAVKDNNLDRVLAVKFMHPKDVEKAGRNDKFIAEAAVSAKLDHPNILPIHDLDYTDGCIPFFSMRLASGQSLEEAIKDKHAFTGTRLDIIFKKVDAMIKVCEATAYAHSKGIVHSDIKPGNIMIGEYGDVLLVDWGTGTTIEQRAEQENKILGTPIYMSPEQSRKECCDQLSDIYCIGTTLLHLITGRFPIYSDDIDTFWNLKKEGWYQKFNNQERHDIPPPLAAIIEHCLEPDRDLRYQSVNDALKDLRNFQKGEVVSVYHDPIIAQVKRIAKKNKKALSIAAVCCACVVIVGYFIYLEKLKEMSHWHQIYQSDMSGPIDGKFAADWTTYNMLGWTINNITEGELKKASLWSLADNKLFTDPLEHNGCSAIVSNIQSTGNLKVSWTAHTGREHARDLNMFIAGNNRYDSYLFHIGGFGRADQIRLTKYTSVQTLDIHTLEQELLPQHSYHFTAIKAGPTVQLYMNNKLIIDYTDPIPFVGPQHENFGFETAQVPYAISNITAWNQPLPQKISPMIIADDYFSHGHFQLALETYDDIRSNYSNMAAVALFRSAQCLYKLDKKVDAQFRLKQFMKSYPGHVYQAHAYSSLCTISLDQGNWKELNELLSGSGKEFNHLKEVAWLRHIITNAIADKFHLKNNSCEIDDAHKTVLTAYQEIRKLEQYFTQAMDDYQIGAHAGICKHLENMGRYQEIIDLYPDSRLSTEA
ncbi:MAG: protein kinase, partial [Planctomycetes bacterium]|nr:protein kinase [Planctomycetota bacterium]